MSKTLARIFTPKNHQLAIRLLAAKLNSATPNLNERTLKQIAWHTDQHLAKTGKLPE